MVEVGTSTQVEGMATGGRDGRREEHRPSVGTGGRAGDRREAPGGKAPAFMIVFSVLGGNRGAYCTSADTVAFGHSPAIKMGPVLPPYCN